MNLYHEQLNIPVQEINHSLLALKEVKLSVLRLDQTDPHVSGNKYFKLKYNLKQAESEGKDTILSFGGAYSNHIAALASSGKHFGFKTIGMIRGEEILPLNATLEQAIKNGMEIHYMDRISYRNKENVEVFDTLRETFGDFYFLPEGGTNQYAMEGTREIMDFVPNEYDTICCGIGTGGTIAGLIEATSTSDKQSILGFAALKGDFVFDMINQLLSKPYDHWQLAPDYSFGGFAKTKPELIDFMLQFEQTHDLPLEQVYTGKMLFGIMDMIENDYFNPGTKIMAIHTGGLQGRAIF